MTERDDAPRDEQRLGLEAFDRVDAPDQWDEIVRRSAGPDLAPVVGLSRGRSRSVSTWLMAAAAVVLIAVAAFAISTRSDDDTAPTPATTPDDTLPTPDTAVPATTVPVTSTPDTSSPSPAVPDTTVPDTTVPDTTVPAVVPDPAVVTAWDPDCVELVGDGADRGPAASDPALSEFTTLAGAPALDIELPGFTDMNGPTPPRSGVAVVPGGVALVTYGSAEENGALTEIAAAVVIDDDGAIRWRRCFADAGTFGGMTTAPDDPTRLWLAMNDHVGADSQIRALDLATGLDAGAPIALGDSTVLASTDRFALAARRWDGSAIEPGDELVLFDAADGSTTAIPYPDVAFGAAPDAIWYHLVETDDDTDDDGVLISGTAYTSPSPDVVFVGGAWSDADDDLRRLPPTLHAAFGANPVRLVDGAGSQVWAVAGLHDIGREGFQLAIAESVALVMDCVSWTEEKGCAWSDDGTPPDERLVALDLATGDELWARPGSHAVGAIVGDRGIVTADLDGDGELDGWELIDLRTGARITDEPIATWAGIDNFRNGCCGEGDYVWTHVDGGVLFESLGERMRVWLPPSVSVPTIVVTAFE